MIILKTLQKGFFNKKDGTRVVDLIRGIFNFTSLMSKKHMKLYKVTDETVMRADLLSQYIYGDQNRLDMLLKFNGISNPFSLYLGQLIFAPSERDLLSAEKQKTDIATDRTKTKKSNALVKPKTTKDKARLTYLSKLTNQPILPTNAVTPGDTGITIVNGNVSFGDDVTQVKKKNCPDPVSRTQIKEALIAAKIFNG